MMQNEFDVNNPKPSLLAGRRTEATRAQLDRWRSLVRNMSANHRQIATSFEENYNELDNPDAPVMARGWAASARDLDELAEWLDDMALSSGHQR